jgi:carboxyl-terminal processing protease
MLKGPKGTVVRIVVTREGYADPLTFTVTRGEIPRHSVDIAFMLKPGIGYIRLSSFNETTDREIADALKQLNATASTADSRYARQSGRPAERGRGGRRHVP